MNRRSFLSAAAATAAITPAAIAVASAHDTGAALGGARSMLDEIIDMLENGGSHAGDVFQAAVVAGAVQENQYLGLGSTLGSTLQGRSDRACCMKSLILDATEPSDVSVLDVVYADEERPEVFDKRFNIGKDGAPLSMFRATSVRFGISFGRRLLRPNTSVKVVVKRLITRPEENWVHGGLIVDAILHEHEFWTSGRWKA